MRNRISVLVSLVLLCGVGGAAPAPDAVRRLRYACDYFIYDAMGKFQNKMRIEGVQTRDDHAKTIRWTRPSIAFGSTLEGPCGAPMPQRYMEGMTYAEADIANMLTAGFFKGFPATPLALLMKNTVVDSHMFELFALELDTLKLHEPRRSQTSGSQMTLFGDQGAQALKRLDLTWVGDSTVNGTPCRVIQFQSSVDPVTMNLQGASQVASTIFWGTMWVSPTDKKILSATMHEHTLTAPTNPEANMREVQNIYRMVTLRSEPERP